MNELPILLVEPFNQQWQRELLFIPVKFAPEECSADSISFHGPNGKISSQLVDIECWPGTEYVKQAKLAFITDLDPLSSLEFRLYYGDDCQEQSEHTTDLILETTDKLIKLSTDEVSISLFMVNEKFPDPIAANKAPVPIKCIQVKNGPEFGTSCLYGPGKITEVQTRVIENGPVLLKVGITYSYIDGNEMSLIFSLAAGDSVVCVDEKFTGDLLDDGWRLFLCPGLKNPVLDQLPWKFGENSWGSEQGKAADIDLISQPLGLITNLVPWRNWWDDRTQMIWTIKTPESGKFLTIAKRQAGDWVVPASPGTLCPWDGWRRKMIPIIRGDSDDIYLQMNAAEGQRKWLIGSTTEGLDREFQTVYDYILEWDDWKKHPYVFLDEDELSTVREKALPEHLEKLFELSAEESNGVPHIADSKALAAYLLAGTRQSADQVRLLDRLNMYLNCYGNFDTMRFLINAITLYDAIVDSDLVDAGQRQVIRSKMAALAYKLSSPDNWSVERGYRSYNLNMSVNHILNLGRIACVLKGHPMTEIWLQPALAMMEDMLDQVGPEGEWPESISNYVQVSTSALISFAIMAKNADFADYVNDERMKKLCRCMARQYCPGNVKPAKPGTSVPRALPPFGRSNGGHRWALAGIMARATYTSDPKYSAEQQWHWLQTGCTHDSEQFAGFEELYPDPSLPAKQPDLTSEMYPQAGVIFRHRFGTENEFYANLMSTDFNHQIFPSETGGFSMIYAKGTPLIGSFYGGYAEREEFLTSRVSLARATENPEQRQKCLGYTGTPITPEEEMSGKRLDKPLADFDKKQPGISNIKRFACLPVLDYTVIDVSMIYPQKASFPLVTDLPEWPEIREHGDPPLFWRRHVLFIKSETSSLTDYLVIRDTVSGDQPTTWSMWSLSDFIDTPGKIKGHCELSTAKNQVIKPARELFGNRFTALGQRGVDIEYYIATPEDTPRHTLRWGTTYKPERCIWHPVSKLEDNYPEYRDLLHLQLPGDGDYFTTLFPRKREEKSPEFSTLCDGKVINVKNGLDSDFIFLNHQPATVNEDDFSFQGTAGSIQRHHDGTTLSLTAPGTTRFEETALSSEQPASIEISSDKKHINVYMEKGTKRVAINILGKWQLMDDSKCSFSMEETTEGFIICARDVLRQVTLKQK